MTAKQYLSEVKRLDEYISSEREFLAELRISAKSPRAIRTDFDRVRGGNYQLDTVGRAVSMIDGLQNAIILDTVNLLFLRHEVINQIHHLEEVAHIEVLYKRYLEMKGLALVAREMRITYDYARELHGKALREFERVYPWVVSSEAVDKFWKSVRKYALS